MMINPQAAIQIAAQHKNEQPSGIMANADGYVVGFSGPNPYDNLPVWVDRQSGEATTLAANDYAKIMGTLQRVTA